MDIAVLDIAPFQIQAISRNNFKIQGQATMRLPGDAARRIFLRWGFSRCASIAIRETDVIRTKKGDKENGCR